VALCLGVEDNEVVGELEIFKESVEESEGSVDNVKVPASTSFFVRKNNIRGSFGDIFNSASKYEKIVRSFCAIIGKFFSFFIKNRA